MKAPLSLSLLCLLLLTLLACSKTVQLGLHGYKEFRSSTPLENRLDLEILLQEIPMQENAYLKFVQAAGITNTGDPLQLKHTSWQMYNVFSEYKINMDSPPRSAVEIDRVRGNLHIFTPSEQRRSKLLFEGIPLASELNLLSEYAEEIQLFIVDTLDVASEIQKSRARYREQLDSRSDLTADEVAEQARKFDNVLELGNSLFENADKAVYFLINDPQDRIINIEIYDGEQKNQEAGGFYFNLSSFVPPLQPLKLQAEGFPEFKAMFLKKPPEADWTLEILVVNKASIEEYAFELQHIPLK